MNGVGDCAIKRDVGGTKKRASYLSGTIGWHSSFMCSVTIWGEGPARRRRVPVQNVKSDGGEDAPDSPQHARCVRSVLYRGAILKTLKERWIRREN